MGNASAGGLAYVPTGAAGGGVGVSLGGNTAGVLTNVTSGTLFLAGGNNVTLSQNGQSVTISGANAGGAQTGISSVVVSNTTYTSGAVSFSNANGISFGSSAGQAITASYTVPSTAGLISAINVSGGTTSGNLSAITFSNSNGVSFGLNASTMTAAVATTAAYYFQGNTTGQSSSSTGQDQTLSISAAGIISAGWSNSSLVFSASQSNQNVSLFALGNTTQNSSTVLNANALSFNGIGEATVGFSNGSIQVSVPPSSVGVSTGGNTSGNTGTYPGQVIFAGGNNITLSVSSAAGGAQTITISGPNVGGAQTGISGVVVSNTTYTSGTISFSNANGISFGSSAGQAITASYTVPTQTNQTLSFAATSNTTGNTSGMSVDARSLTLAGYGGVSVGYSTSAGGSSIVVSALVESNQAFSAQGGSSAFQTLAFTNSNNVSFSNTGGSVWGSYALNVSAAGGTSNALSGLTFSNVNGVSFGLSTGAGIGTLSASVAAQSNQNMSLYALGNTTQNSSTVLNASVLSFNGLGAQTVGYSNGSIQLSVPATSSLSATGGVSIVVNASTISIGVAVVPQYSFFNALSGDVTTLTQIGQGSVQVYPINNAKPFSASRADMMMQNTVSSSSNSSHAGVVSAYMGIYTLNGSTLSLASSGSQSYQWTNTSNNSMGSVSGQRRLSVPINVNYTGGDIWMGVMSLTSSTNANWFTASNLVIQPQLTGQLMGLIGEASANSKQLQPGLGVFSTTSNAMPVSMGLSAISGAGSAGTGANVYMAPVQFANVTA